MNLLLNCYGQRSEIENKMFHFLLTCSKQQATLYPRELFLIKLLKRKKAIKLQKRGTGHRYSHKQKSLLKRTFVAPMVTLEHQQSVLNWSIIFGAIQK